MQVANERARARGFRGMCNSMFTFESWAWHSGVNLDCSPGRLGISSLHDWLAKTASRSFITSITLNVIINRRPFRCSTICMRRKKVCAMKINLCLVPLKSAKRSRQNRFASQTPPTSLNVRELICFCFIGELYSPQLIRISGNFQSIFGSLSLPRRAGLFGFSVMASAPWITLRRNQREVVNREITRNK